MVMTKKAAWKTSSRLSTIYLWMVIGFFGVKTETNCLKIPDEE